MPQRDFDLIVLHLNVLEHPEEVCLENTRECILLLATCMQAEIDYLKYQLEESEKEVRNLKNYALKLSNVMDINAKNIRRKINGKNPYRRCPVGVLTFTTIDH